ncbi:MAG: dependent oxidoreductase [Myxococcaceae bacterium]|nr:dependent oxidoreductase [Myxococcaceae bacterium]
MEAGESVYWFEQVAPSGRAPLTGSVSADAVVVGGGIAGLSAAQRLLDAGLAVALVEADTCGAGATGRSSGFITPDSELQLADLARRFGDDTARRLYAGARASCDHVRATIERHGLRCDLVECDSVYAALDEAGARTLREEHEVRRRLGFASSYLDAGAVPSAVATRRYAGAVRYGDTFAINAAAYAAGLRDALAAAGVAVYERSPVTSIAPGVVTTRGGEVRAPRVILCLDRYAPSLGVATRAVHHARAYLTLTEALDRGVIASLFPAGPVMLWDTDLIYQYLRPTAEGRILVGGGALSRTYVDHAADAAPVYAKLERYLEETFPALRGVRFTHRWHGLIGVTKDILPLAGVGADGRGAFHALAGAGLPWSVTAGRVAAERALSGAVDRDDVFDPGRAFTTLDPLQPLLGKPLTWMLAYPLARSVERGGSARVRARQRALGAAVLLALGALVWAAWRRRR